ncbi:MAG: hypothetical protein DRJ10_07470 [Bacteroidetes bacterium]|nr:MAG: hypothetical protein DRJ10_07470 [Bacteroidota bacterium]
MKYISKLINSFLLLILVIISVFFACGEQATTENQTGIEIIRNTKVLKSVNEVFETLPSPMETSELIVQADVKFNDRILNPVRNVPYYETSKSLALNLGIYCADMSYVSHYNQKQLTMEYLSAIKTLADNLGIIQVMSKNDIIMLEDNVYNQDSIRIIIKDVFFSSNEYLNESNRPEMALLVQVGGWIEGLYIAMQLATQSVDINKELVDRIVEQKESLNLVLKSLKNYSEYAGIDDIYMDMLQLQKIYNRTNIYDSDSIQNAPENMADKSKANVTPEIFISLYKEINNIRNDYTQ